MASKWWDINGISKFLHLMNPVRTKYIARASRGIFEKKILDVGCGAGILSESLYYEGGIVTGLDISSKMIHEARMHAKVKNINIKYLHEDISDHVENYVQYYDVIVCMEVLEHTHNPMEIIRMCSRLIKPAEYLFRLIPMNTHSFSQFITPSELLNYLDHTNCIAQDVVGIKYNLCKKNFYLSSNVLFLPNYYD
uniref:Methyltransferase type 11 domain-containing protein n=1 Tax=Glossina pallidipes TaxID=7398 RepID=A0A1A9Z191_GLOPL